MKNLANSNVFVTEISLVVGYLAEVYLVGGFFGIDSIFQKFIKAVRPKA